MWEIQAHVHIRVICNVDPYVQTLYIPLVRKTLVSKIDLEQDPLYMDPQYRVIPTTILMS